MQQPAGALGSIRSITVWLEDENGVKRPTEYGEARCILGGLKDGVPIARVLNDAGDVVDFIGCTMRVIHTMSALVAAGPGSIPALPRTT